MIGFDEAIGLLRPLAVPLGAQEVALEHAAGRYLAEPVVARIAAPAADVSAMDGYAVRDADLHPDVVLKVVGQSYPGAGFAGGVEAGQAVRIFTGAPVPVGADRVVVQEIVSRDGDRIRLAEMPGKGTHIRQRGSDFEQGAVLLAAGTRLSPGAMIAVAGADRASVTVWRRPRLAIVSTGDELVPPGLAASRQGFIPESVSYGVAAMAQVWGADVIARSHLADDLATMQAAATRVAAQADLVVVTGGASVGERDFSRRMFEPLGITEIFAKVAIKPGKPVWLARAGGTLVLGLPGNPTSALVTARLFLAPLLAGMGGGDPETALDWQRATLGAPLRGCGDRETFTRAAGQGAGVVPLSDQDSGAQRALAHAQWLIRQRSSEPAREAGKTVNVIAF